MVGKVFYFLWLCSFLQFLVVDAISYDEDTIITLDEPDAIVNLRSLVLSKLPHKYMEERFSSASKRNLGKKRGKSGVNHDGTNGSEESSQIFLHGFITIILAQNFEVKAAEEALLKHIDWRAKNKIEEIDDEDWEDFKKDFSWNLDGVDETGRPLVQIALKSWKSVAKATGNGQGDRLVRWFGKYMEDATKLIRKSQSQGKKVTRFTFILDGEGFNIADFGFPACLLVYVKAAETLSQQYPGSVERKFFTSASDNMSEIFKTYLVPAMSKDLRKIVKIYGTDREIWRNDLSKFIEDDQLLPAFGGTMKAE